MDDSNIDQKCILQEKETDKKNMDNQKPPCILAVPLLRNN